MSHYRSACARARAKHFPPVISPSLPLPSCPPRGGMGKPASPGWQLQRRSQVVPEVPVTTQLCGSTNAPQPKPHPPATTGLLFSSLWLH